MTRLLTNYTWPVDTIIPLGGGYQLNTGPGIMLSDAENRGPLRGRVWCENADMASDYISNELGLNHISYQESYQLVLAINRVDKLHIGATVTVRGRTRSFLVQKRAHPPIGGNVFLLKKYGKAILQSKINLNKLISDLRMGLSSKLVEIRYQPQKRFEFEDHHDHTA